MEASWGSAENRVVLTRPQRLAHEAPGHETIVGPGFQKSEDHPGQGLVHGHHDGTWRQVPGSRWP